MNDMEKKAKVALVMIEFCDLTFYFREDSLLVDRSATRGYKELLGELGIEPKRFMRFCKADHGREGITLAKLCEELVRLMPSE